ncbi:MAG: hypothetical protein FWF75_01655 [Propionibacteriaceae bacterium]|nr:hypothetical protein [Propionibacteriaceae bacterium]
MVDKATAQLLRFAATMDTQSAGEAVFLVVVTVAGYAYVRPDGVLAIPLGLLGAQVPGSGRPAPAGRDFSASGRPKTASQGRF